MSSVVIRHAQQSDLAALLEIYKLLVLDDKNRKTTAI